MLMTKERRPAFRTIEGWAKLVLIEAGAIRECEEHGWARDRADPHARERALLIARQDPPPGIPPDEAVAAVRDVLDTIGDTCPECSPESGYPASAVRRLGPHGGVSRTGELQAALAGNALVAHVAGSPCYVQLGPRD
jgi:hypothetical protein